MTARNRDRRFSLLLTPLLFAAGGPSFAASPKKSPPAKQAATVEKSSASADTISLVEHVTRVASFDLPPEVIPQFMQVDPATLPARLRAPYRAKKAELLMLRKIAEGKKKAPIRRAGKEDEKPLCPREEGDEKYVQALKLFGFEEISEDEERFLMRRLKCTECELQEEFSLTIVVVPPKKKGAKHVQYLFLNESDPIMALVAKYREGSEGGTDFFGAFYGACH